MLDMFVAKIHFRRNLKSSLNLLFTISFDNMVSLAYPLPSFFHFFLIFSKDLEGLALLYRRNEK